MKPKNQRYLEDLSGMSFGRLTAISISKKDTKRRGYWNCVCICGNKKIVRRDSLLRGMVKSCGCLQYDAIRKVAGPIKNVAVKRVFSKYASSAKNRGIEFSLTPVQLENIVTKRCIYCGKEPENTITRHRINDTFNYSGIDRVDNSKGYIEGNTVPCCWDCNLSKHSRTREEFLSWIKRVYEYNFKDEQAFSIDPKLIEG